jgi:hypothetical protein
MSKLFVSLSTLFVAFLLILQTFNNCRAQDIEAKIDVGRSSPQLVEVRGRFRTTVGRNFVIQRQYSGIPGLAERVSDVVLEDKDGKTIAYKQFMQGEYVAEADIASFRYTMNLRPLAAETAVARTSWLTGSVGLLFLDDLLPLIPGKKESVFSKVDLEMPNGWTIAGGRSSLETADVDKTVFAIGRSLREIATPASDLRIVTEGEWKFTDADAKDFVGEIYGEYRKLFGGAPNNSPTIFLTHFPQNVGFGRWEGDTRGSTVTIVSSDMPFRTPSVQRLHEQLRHEMFHLWMPNSVSLSGNYDWFYEGFALYQSLKTGVALNRLRFDDFLDTLGRAYSIDSSLPNRRSLIDLSTNRVSGGDTELYARGMIVAFLTDVELLKRKQDISSVLRKIFEQYRNSSMTGDGNAAVLKAIGLPDVERYVEGTERINWADALRSAGIESTEKGPVTTLSIVPKPSGRQRELLDKLGYNNWRRSGLPSQ